MRFTLYSRVGCSLCEEMRDELAAMPEVQGIPVDVIDVDRVAALRARYGHKIPVLLLGGELVCHGRLEPEEVHKALAHQR